jgi:hypothetical protein
MAPCRATTTPHRALRPWARRRPPNPPLRRGPRVFLCLALCRSLDILLPSPCPTEPVRALRVRCIGFLVRPGVLLVVRVAYGFFCMRLLHSSAPSISRKLQRTMEPAVVAKTRLLEALGRTRGINPLTTALATAASIWHFQFGSGTTAPWRHDWDRTAPLRPVEPLRATGHARPQPLPGSIQFPEGTIRSWPAHQTAGSAGALWPSLVQGCAQSN